MKEDTEEHKKSLVLKLNLTGSDVFPNAGLAASLTAVVFYHWVFAAALGKTAERCVGPVSGHTGWRVVPH